MTAPLVELADVRKRYGDRSTGRLALDGVSLAIAPGELVAIVGTSGSGKSTLLNVMGVLDAGYEGTVKLAGREVRALSDAELSRVRQRTVGFVFQAFHLLLTEPVRANVSLPASFAPAPVADLAARVEQVLARVGLAGRADDLPENLSGGQRQRVALARALLLRPPLLLCDEPTGSLDTQTGAQILALFQQLHKESPELALVLVTHEERVAAIATRTVRLEDGRVVADERRGAGASGSTVEARP